ncbi:acyl-CoA dehydrogenase [Parvularcula bermudensis HTCC2503]|uniref:3-methylmercaptopropionyl-CoA dehydrogenase n=1 Tax=Parvularcula bermudensis (strain ATCC BAA-594 / HTCC2503 / KCTC 12087) TaxID=314260 RepID=E0TBZ8_PARBH|nr:acyl-CoA dehydrogenase [Parvularcula bermudensis]ADM09791.1 acyl-CoA dehydrogenase [Parvularcula bermudensis HTCC2503]
MPFATPVRDMQFILEHAANFDAVRDIGAYDDLSEEIIDAVLTEVAKLADNVFAPLNWTSDQQGARLENGQVYTTPGFKEAYQEYVEGGWNAVAFPEEYGGQGMPSTIALAVYDALSAACISLSMGMSLTQGAVKALLKYGTDEQKALYLPKMATAEWSGTMNLSEPHAGSDLSQLKCKAEPVGDGTFKIKGTKCWISYGDHDLTENICHLVLARLPDAPEGTKGISMFLVPKYRVNEDGSLGSRNDVNIVSIEEKLGQHGSPTCVISFGDDDDCLGTLVGKENEGLKNMFVMMNSARIDVGMQGTSASEASFQKALQYAQERPQGRPYGVRSGPQVPIYEHPDVRRQLMTMRALTDASRALGYAAAIAHDIAEKATDEDVRRAAKEREDLLTPLAKAFPTDRAMEVTNHGIQIHGGMGFVEETGAAQFYRDARITQIYEGTNGIQAIDLVGRKLGMGEGKLAFDFMDDISALSQELADSDNASLVAIGKALDTAVKELRDTTEYMIKAMSGTAEDGLAGATPYLDQFGYVAGAYYLARGAKVAAKKSAEGDDPEYHDTKVHITRFYTDNVLPRATGLIPAVKAGAETVAKLDPEKLAS